MATAITITPTINPIIAETVTADPGNSQYEIVAAIRHSVTMTAAVMQMNQNFSAIDMILIAGGFTHDLCINQSFINGRLVYELPMNRAIRIPFILRTGFNIPVVVKPVFFIRYKTIAVH